MYVYQAFIYTLRYLNLAKRVRDMSPFITKDDKTPVLRISPLLLVQSRSKAFQLTVPSYYYVFVVNKG